jgi:hypothetical protein
VVRAAGAHFAITMPRTPCVRSTHTESLNAL